MLFGAQVRQTGGFLAAIARAEDMGAEVVQLFAQNNRQWAPPHRDHDVYAAYREAADKSPVVKATVCHAPYLINVVSPDPVTRDRSRDALIANLEAATSLGAFGLVLHPGSHRGVDPVTATGRIAEIAQRALDTAERTDRPVCDLLLENTAGAGGTVGRTLDELAEIIDATGGDPRIGVCLDTQHLWASGIDYSTPRKVDALVHEITSTIGLDRLRCVHLNDSKVDFGSNRDRHENLGEGLIGERTLAALIGHPDLQDLPAVLEVPGIHGNGPGPADLSTAKHLHRRGRRARYPSRYRSTASTRR